MNPSASLCFPKLSVYLIVTLLYTKPNQTTTATTKKPTQMILKFYEGGTEFCTEVFISCRKNSNNETNYAGLIFQSFFSGVN